MEAIVVAAPLPPTRPVEFVGVPANQGPAAAPGRNVDDDLIAALLEHGRLPGEITHGLKSSPRDALALADPNAGPRARDSAAALARAAALSAQLPPLPPPRPNARAATAKDAGISNAPRSTPAPPPARGHNHGSAAASPFGGLVVDAFNDAGVSPSPNPEGLPDGLRGSAQ